MLEQFYDFTVKPFEDVMEECRKISKKYFSCFPLLFQIGTLIVNNSMESGNRDRSMTAIEEAKDLFICVKSDSEDAELCRLAFNFDLKKLHPALLVKFYIISAQGYTMVGNTDKALEILENYAEPVTGDIYPLKIKGDDYFNLLEEWIETLDLGDAFPRNDKIICQSMVDGVIKNPAFTALSDEPQFQRIVERLKNKLLGGTV